jgi:hypothetical protein
LLHSVVFTVVFYEIICSLAGVRIAGILIGDYAICVYVISAIALRAQGLRFRRSFRDHHTCTCIADCGLRALDHSALDIPISTIILANVSAIFTGILVWYVSDNHSTADCFILTTIAITA